MLGSVATTIRSFNVSRWIIAGLALVVIAGAGWTIYQRTRPVTPTVTAGQPVAVSKGTVESRVSATGATVLTKQAKLTFGASGTVKEVLVKVGDQAEPGQALARLDSTQTELRLDQAKSSLTVSQLKLKQLTAGASQDEIAAAQASYGAAKARYDDLLAGAPKEDLAAAETSVASAQAGLRSAEARLALLKAGATASDVASARQSVVSAQGALQKAQSDLDKLKAGPAVADLRTAEADLERAKNSLWSTQISRDSTCGNDPTRPACQSADAQVGNAEASVRLAEQRLADMKAGASTTDLTNAANTVESARAQLDSAQARYNQATSGAIDADIRAAESSVESAKANYQSAINKLASLKANAKVADVQQAVSQLSSAKATLDQKMGKVSDIEQSMSEEQVKQAGISVKQAEFDLKNTALIAPFAGVIASITGNLGDSAGSANIVIVDPRALRIDISVDETDVPKVAVGQQVSLSFDALPNVRLTGVVTSVSPVATVQQGVASYPVTIQITNLRQQIPAGMTAIASILVTQKSDVLLVPNRAIKRQGREQLVDVVTPNGTETRQVQTGINDERFTEIVSGLAEGEQVLLPAPVTRQANPGAGFGGPGGGFGGPGGGFGGGPGFQAKPAGVPGQ